MYYQATHSGMHTLPQLFNIAHQCYRQGVTLSPYCRGDRSFLYDTQEEYG